MIKGNFVQKIVIFQENICYRLFNQIFLHELITSSKSSPIGLGLQTGLKTMRGDFEPNLIIFMREVNRCNIKNK